MRIRRQPPSIFTWICGRGPAECRKAIGAVAPTTGITEHAVPYRTEKFPMARTLAFMARERH